MRKEIILFEAIGPFHVNFHHDVLSKTNFLSCSPMCEMVSQQENRSSFFTMKRIFSLRARVAKNLPVGPSSFYKMVSSEKSF